MKKITILTSVLALAACAGGSGGGNGGTPAAAVTPSQNRVSDSAIASNKELTTMVSEILVAQDGTSPSIVRSATTTNVNGKTYKVYNLNDVEFTTASTFMNMEIDAGAKVQFKVDDDGRVDKINIKIADDKNDFDSNVNRDTENGNTFSGGYNFVGEDGEETLDEGFYVRHRSGSKDHDVKLRYSDFGVIEWGDRLIDGNKNYDTSNYFAGGYQSQKVDVKDIQSDMNFTGTADATVRVGDLGDETPMFVEGENKLSMVDNNATLKFDKDTKTSTITANFAENYNWYNVTATMGSDGKMTELKFTDGADVADKLKWKGDTDGTFIAEKKTGTFETGGTDPKTGEPTHRTYVHDGFVQYYHGVENNIPEEAVGVVRYADSDGANDKTYGSNMRFDMGFGAKK